MCSYDLFRLYRIVWILCRTIDGFQMSLSCVDILDIHDSFDGEIVFGGPTKIFARRLHVAIATRQTMR